MRVQTWTGKRKRAALKRTMSKRRRGAWKQTSFTRRRSRRNSRTGGFLGIELKFYDTALVAAAIASPTNAAGGEANPSATICLNSITQGDGESQRDGRNCVVKTMHIKGVVDVPPAINQTANFRSPVVYIAVVHDRQTNGALLNSEDVFINPAGSAILAASPQRNLQFIKRFRVLKSRTLVVPQINVTYDGTNMEASGQQMPFEMHIDGINLTSNYSGTTESIANITDNSLSLIAYTSNAGLSPTLSYTSRVRFVG